MLAYKIANLEIDTTPPENGCGICEPAAQLENRTHKQPLSGLVKP
jgi:hypothetical protein